MDVRRKWKRRERDSTLTQKIRDEERRLRRWEKEGSRILQEKRAGLDPKNPHYLKAEKRERWMKKFRQERTEKWLNTHFVAASEPTTQLVLAIEGIGGG